MGSSTIKKSLIKIILFICGMFLVPQVFGQEIGGIVRRADWGVSMSPSPKGLVVRRVVAGTAMDRAGIKILDTVRNP